MSILLPEDLGPFKTVNYLTALGMTARGLDPAMLETNTIVELLSPEEQEILTVVIPIPHQVIKDTPSHVLGEQILAEALRAREQHLKAKSAPPEETGAGE